MLGTRYEKQVECDPAPAKVGTGLTALMAVGLPRVCRTARDPQVTCELLSLKTQDPPI